MTKAWFEPTVIAIPAKAGEAIPIEVRTIIELASRIKSRTGFAFSQ